MKLKVGMRVRYDGNHTGTIIALKGDKDPWHKQELQSGVVILPDDKTYHRHTRFENTGTHWTILDSIREVLHDPSILDDSLFRL